MAREETPNGRQVIAVMKENEIQIVEVQLKADQFHGGLKYMRETEMILRVRANGTDYQASRRIWLDRPDDFSSIFDEAIEVVKYSLIKMLKERADKL